jgi:hypothetical protein
MMRKLGAQLLLFVAPAVMAACNVSPQPLPPGDPPSIDTTQLSLVEGAAGQPGLVGAVDAVANGTTVRLTNLDNTAAPIDATVAEDGSFTIGTGGVLGNIFRLQAIGTGGRSLPIDVTGMAFDTPVELAPVPTPCLVLEPDTEIVGAPVGLDDPIQPFTVVARNDCAFDVTVVGAELRTGVDFQMLTGAGAFPQVLQTGDTFTIEYGFKSLTSGDFEDVLFITLDMVGGDRRAITVRSTTN